jgi:hypothetical protein
MAPAWTPDQKGVKVQIVDVFALKLATGYEKDPTGRLLLQSEESVSTGRTWSLAKACQLVRNDANPNRWVVLHRHKKAWGLFWAGGGLDQCRDELSKLLGSEATSSAIVPATPEAILQLVLALEEPQETPKQSPKEKKPPITSQGDHLQSQLLIKAIGITSLLWLCVVVGSITYGSFISSQQNQKIDALIDLIERKELRK